MRYELIEVLTGITDTHLIRKILLNMNSKDIFNLMSLLEFTNTDAQSRWLDTYNQILKY